MGLKMASVKAKWDLSWPKMAPSWLKLARIWTKLVPNTTKLGPSWLGMKFFSDFGRSKQALGPSQGVRGATKDAPGMHQGGTKDAPMTHQGCTKDASGNKFDIDMGPRAHFKSNKVLEYLTVNQSALI